MPLSGLANRNAIDLTGQRFGRLLVLQVSHSANGLSWICKCDCGREHTIKGVTLRSDVTISCGCYQREMWKEKSKAGRVKGIVRPNLRKFNQDLTGQQSGYLTVVRPAPERGARTWLCRCKCSKDVFAETCEIARRTRVSCGCMRGDIVRDRWARTNSVQAELFCTFCKTLKPRDSFYKKAGPYSKRWHCKECRSIISTLQKTIRRIIVNWFDQVDRDISLAKQKADTIARSRTKRRERAARERLAHADYFANYREVNKEKLKANKKRWQHDNKERISDNRLEKRLINLEAIRTTERERSRRYRKNNSDKRKHSANAWARRNKSYMAYMSMLRYAITLRAVPRWANHTKIKEIYKEARIHGMHVDHIVPLKSKYVCGLHWEGNLQLLPPLENIRKSNKWWPGWPGVQHGN